MHKEAGEDGSDNAHFSGLSRELICRCRTHRAELIDSSQSLCFHCSNLTLFYGRSKPLLTLLSCAIKPFAFLCLCRTVSTLHALLVGLFCLYILFFDEAVNQDPVWWALCCYTDRSHCIQSMLGKCCSLQTSRMLSVTVLRWSCCKSQCLVLIFTTTGEILLWWR